MKIRLFFFLLFFIFASLLWAADSPAIRLVSERHRTEWNWVEYRVSLKNISSLPVLNPEIRYFAQNTMIQYCRDRVNEIGCRNENGKNVVKDTLLSVAVDYATWPFSSSSRVSSEGLQSVVRISLGGILYPGKSVDVNFRIYPKDWRKWSPVWDWSYQKLSNVAEPNYFMAVYDASNILLWGYDPLSGGHNSDVVLMTDRGSNIAIPKFEGDSSEYVPAGRFWLLKERPLSAKERRLLSQRGVSTYSSMPYWGKILILLKADSSVKKLMLDSTLAEFYNAIRVNDSTAVELDAYADDFYDKKRVCGVDGGCSDEITVRNELDLDVGCWADESVNACVSAISRCGGKGIGVARKVISTTVALNSIGCLESRHEVEWLAVRREHDVANSGMRSAVNVDVL